MMARFAKVRASFAKLLRQLTCDHAFIYREIQPAINGQTSIKVSCLWCKRTSVKYQSKTTG